MLPLSSNDHPSLAQRPLGEIAIFPPTQSKLKMAIASVLGPQSGYITLAFSGLKIGPLTTNTACLRTKTYFLKFAWGS